MRPNQSITNNHQLWLEGKFLSAEALASAPFFDESVSLETIIASLNSPESLKILKEGHPEVYQEYLTIRRQTAKFQNYFAKKIKEYSNYNPLEVHQRALSKIQEKTLQALSNKFRIGHQSQVIKLAPGSGKTLIMGSLAKTYLEAVAEFNHLNGTNIPGNIVILTSRRFLVEQLAHGQINSKKDLDFTGDLSIPLLDLTQNPSELITLVNTDNKITDKTTSTPIVIMTYQGVSEVKLEKLFGKHFHQKIGLVLLDEGHNSTSEVIDEQIQDLFPSALKILSSATPDVGDRKSTHFIETIAIEHGAKERIFFGEAPSFRAYSFEIAQMEDFGVKRYRQ